MSLPVTCNWTKPPSFIIEQKRGACLQATRASSGRLLSRLGMDCSLPENVFVAVKAAGSHSRRPSRVIYCTAKLANRYLFSQEPDLHARRYISGHIFVELLSSRSLWFLGPASHLLARTVHIQRGGRLNKQASHSSL